MFCVQHRKAERRIASQTLSCIEIIANRIRIILNVARRRSRTFMKVFIHLIQWAHSQMIRFNSIRFHIIIIYYYSAMPYSNRTMMMMLDWNNDLRECTFELLLPFLLHYPQFNVYETNSLSFNVNRPMIQWSF